MNIMRYPEAQKALEYQRYAYWRRGYMVIVAPNDRDGGSAYKKTYEEFMKQE